MKKINNKLIFLIISFSFLIGCQSLKDGLEGNKRSKSAEEFLIEKKNPLVLPPDFSKLPTPKNSTLEDSTENIEEMDIEKILNKGSKKKVEKKSKSTNSVEKSILKKLTKLMLSSSIKFKNFKK